MDSKKNSGTGKKDKNAKQTRRKITARGYSSGFNDCKPRKEYYAWHPHNFSNEYTVIYAENEDDIKAINKLKLKEAVNPNCSLERITRKEALKMVSCKDGYHNESIVPAANDQLKYYCNGKIIERKKR